MVRSIISTGQGRLHLITSALAIKDAGVDVDVVTGWVPSKRIPNLVIDLMGRLVGRKNLANGMRKRSPAGLEDHKIHQCSGSEFYQQFLFALARIGALNESKAARSGWQCFGRQSCKYIANADVFHVRSGAGCAGAIEHARKQGMAIVVDHSIAHPAEIEGNLSEIEGLAESKNTIRSDDVFWKLVLDDCHNADSILVNSEYVKETLVKHGFAHKRIDVVLLGTRIDFLGLKSNWQTQGPFRLLFTGNFGLRKGASIIIDALERLGRSGFPYKFDVVGSAEPVLRDDALRRLGSKVTFHGHQPQEKLASFLANSDAYVFPSFAEGAAQSAMEAMGAGLPVIVTKETGVPTVHYHNGLMVERNCPTSVVNAIVALEGDVALRTRLGKQATLDITEKSSWGMYGKQVRDVYESLLSKEGK